MDKGREASKKQSRSTIINSGQSKYREWLPKYGLSTLKDSLKLKLEKYCHFWFLSISYLMFTTSKFTRYWKEASNFVHLRIKFLYTISKISIRKKYYSAKYDFPKQCIVYVNKLSNVYHFKIYKIASNFVHLRLLPFKTPNRKK